MLFFPFRKYKKQQQVLLSIKPQPLSVSYLSMCEEGDEWFCCCCFFFIIEIRQAPGFFVVPSILLFIYNISIVVIDRSIIIQLKHPLGHSNRSLKLKVQKIACKIIIKKNITKNNNNLKKSLTRSIMKAENI